MTEAERIESLRVRHADLDRQLESERQRPLPDDDVLAGLKRQKLAIKDQISQLEHV